MTTSSGQKHTVKQVNDEPRNRYSYSAAEKLVIIDYALETSQGKAAYKYGVHKSMISRWMRNLSKIQKADPTTKRIGSGRKPWKQGKETSETTLYQPVPRKSSSRSKQERDVNLEQDRKDQVATIQERRRTLRKRATDLPNLTMMTHQISSSNPFELHDPSIPSTALASYLSSPTSPSTEHSACSPDLTGAYDFLSVVTQSFSPLSLIADAIPMTPSSVSSLSPDPHHHSGFQLDVTPMVSAPPQINYHSSSSNQLAMDALSRLAAFELTSGMFMSPSPSSGST